jgi:phosphoribosylpyrophosphate synthetase
VLAQTGPVALLAPDAGAHKRVAVLAKAMGCSMLCAEKTRDTVSGQLAATRIQGELPELPLLVVDDICDGGGTFLALADAVRVAQQHQQISQPLYLYVTHGIFSKGADALLQRYQRILPAIAGQMTAVVKLCKYPAQSSAGKDSAVLRRNHAKQRKPRSEWLTTVSSGRFL